MNTRMPARYREYEISLSDETEEVEEEKEAVLIEGYKVVFDKKVMTTPVEVVSMVKPVVKPNP